MERVPMTNEGYHKLSDRLKHLKEVARPQNARDIETAREHGDISENAEFHAAKERQAFIAGSIIELEDKLARAEIINPSDLTGTKIFFGATVTLFEVDREEEVRYQIVGQDEADLAAGKISIGSPIARALIGREQGDEVVVKTPGGERTYEISDVEFI